MYSIIKTIYNYINICYHVNNFYYVTQTKEVNDDDITNFINKIIPSVKYCGCICIKFCQWLTPILENVYTDITNTDKKWLTILEQFYENCSEQSVIYTLQTYKNDFGENLYDKYEIINVIGTGSIGQVYKIQEKITGDFFALKVIHPTCKYDMWLFKIILHILLYIPYTNKIIYDIIPYDIPQFMNVFEEQLDMIHEANNLCKFKYNYKDNPKIIIPDLIKCSHNILVMSYEEGITFDNINKSEYEKMKLAVIFYLFGRNNFEQLNFNHADLHKGNWKISTNDKIVIYDFGYCFTIKNTNIIKYLHTAFTDTDYKKGHSDFKKLVIEIIEDYSDETYQYISEYLEEEVHKDHTLADPQLLLKHIFNVTKHLRIKLNPVSIQSIIIQIQNLKYLTNYSLNNMNEKHQTGYFVYRRDYLNYYSICKTYNIFPKLQVYFKDILNEKQVEVNGIFDMLNEKTEITNEIKNLLTFD